METTGSEILDRLLLDERRRACVTHVETVPARVARHGEWPGWADPLLVKRLQYLGMDRPYLHQVAAAEFAHDGQHVVVSTGTASGKSLGYQLPALTALLTDPRARVLYLAPTKALAHDQLRSLRALNLAAVRAATLDGDTPPPERDWVREHATWVLTNPDMLARSVLPRHAAWRVLLKGLRYVVVDEAHVYRGVFGSHVAHVLRRLRRVCARHGSYPTFVLASATTGTPALSSSRLTGLDVAEVTDDASPRGALSFALYEPPLTTLTGEQGAPVRRSATTEAGELLADLVVDGVRTLAFVRSRRGSELVAMQARRSVGQVASSLVRRVESYRAGYLPEERRELEARLQSGDLLGVAATNALELGLDVSGLDAVILTGWPGTLASLWQQAGRAGRSGGAAAAVLVARDDPLDTYVVHHPASVFGRPVEAAVLDPTNPYVLAPHLECAAAELPLVPADLEYFGGRGVCLPVLDDLVRRGRLRRRAQGWYWPTIGSRPDADLRGTGGNPIALVDVRTGALLGTVDAGGAVRQVYEGAVYLHRGRTYVVEALDLEGEVACLRLDDPDWTTTARDVTDISVLSVRSRAVLGEVEVCLGTVQVRNQVTGYLKRRLATGEVLGEVQLDLPESRLETTAVWYAVAPGLLLRAGVAEADWPGALHAAEHAAIGLLPLVATCDRWDIGGVSTALHPDTGRPTVFVHDGHPGGAGFAERGHAALRVWLGATRDAIASCGCEKGCPSCVQSPKCGNGNDPLDKAGAIRVLTAVLGELGEDAPPASR